MKCVWDGEEEDDDDEDNDLCKEVGMSKHYEGCTDWSGSFLSEDEFCNELIHEGLIYSESYLAIEYDGRFLAENSQFTVV